MLHTILSRFAWFCVLLLLQVTLFNHIHLFGYATPLCYVYFLLILPADTPRWAYISLGFILGLLVDLFTNTPGMGAASLCALGLVTPLLLSAFAPKDKDDDILLPSVATMEWSGFIRYALTSTLLYCAMFFSIESFTFIQWRILLLRIFSSAFLTFVIILIFEVIRGTGRHR